MRKSSTLANNVATLIAQKPGLFIAAIITITALLVIPIITMAPEQTASDQPGGEVYDLQNLYDSKLPRRIHTSFFIAESRDGEDILTKAPLLELYKNGESLRSADRNGDLHPPSLPKQSYLFSGFNPDLNQPVAGIFTLADAVNSVLESIFEIDLENATDDQIKIAIHQISNNPLTAFLTDFVYQESIQEDKNILGQKIDYWTAPAMGIFVAADNGKLGGGTSAIGTTGDSVTTGKEEFNRKVQDVLRGNESNYRLWGIAIDASLESAEEIATAVPFIIATFIMALLVVGACLQSWRITILTGIGLASMLVWLKGISNLIGLDSSTTLDFIVPIAMISLGADFGIHALNRYREEKMFHQEPKIAFRVGMTGVLSALLLAMITDAVAFLSNVSAKIETVVGFGIGAGIAIFAAFVIMGLALPATLMLLDSKKFQSKIIHSLPEESGIVKNEFRLGKILSKFVLNLAKSPLIVLPIALVITIASTYYAFQLESTFDAKDFYRSDSEFVLGLDKLDQYVGDSGGESAIIVVRGDLSNPRALEAIQNFTQNIADNPYVAKNEDTVQLQARSIFHIIDRVINSEYTISLITDSSNLDLFTNNKFNEFKHGKSVLLWPMSQTDLSAIYDHISINGVNVNPSQKLYDQLEVRETLFHDPSGMEDDVTAIVIGIPGTREQSNVILSRESLAKDIELLQEEPSITLAGLTGSPFTRQGSLDATTDSLQKALLISVVACLAILMIAMRSVSLGLVTILPIGLVVSWLYAFMYLFDFGLNFVTATIAAISIGIGIDFAVHLTQRYREELNKAEDKIQAMQQAVEGTGVALLASAATSIIGFAIMGFAPMPVFSAYGILTAVMITMSAIASLLILPTLLLLVSERKTVSHK